MCYIILTANFEDSNATANLHRVRNRSDIEIKAGARFHFLPYLVEDFQNPGWKDLNSGHCAPVNCRTKRVTALCVYVQQTVVQPAESECMPHRPDAIASFEDVLGKLSKNVQQQMLDCLMLMVSTNTRGYNVTGSSRRSVERIFASTANNGSLTTVTARLVPYHAGIAKKYKPDLFVMDIEVGENSDAGLALSSIRKNMLVMVMNLKMCFAVV
jgi:hypothetical protein